MVFILFNGVYLEKFFRSFFIIENKIVIWFSSYIVSNVFESVEEVFYVYFSVIESS